MARLLYVEASPRKDRSASIEVSRAFLEAYRAAHPDDDIETLDIWASDLPSFDGEALAAKYAGLSGVALTARQKTVWDDIRRLAAGFLAADKLLLGTDVELRHSLPAEAIDRSYFAQGHRVRVRRRELSRASQSPEGCCRLRARPRLSVRRLVDASLGLRFSENLHGNVASYDRHH